MRADFSRVLALALLLAACRPPEEEPIEVETVDVPPPLTVDIEQDPQETEGAPALIGVLPRDYPKDLPLYLPASLIDFGSTSEGARFVSLLSAHPMSRVSGDLDRLLSENGWSLEASGTTGKKLRKGSRQVWLRMEEASPGVLYRFEY